MQINQTRTAAESFYSENTQKKVIKKVKAKVLEYIAEQTKLNNPVSNNDITRALGIEYKLISNARWMLIQEGKIKIWGERPDSISKKLNECVVINDTPEMVFPKKTDKEKLKAVKEYCEYRENHSGMMRDILQIINS